MTKRKLELARLSGERDEKILIYLWKWKLATTQALTEKFFQGVAPATAYRRLWRLEQGGFIQTRADRSGRKFLWQLAKRGYEAIRGYLPAELAEDGFRSEHPGHDLLAAAFHMGDFAVSTPTNVTMFSEQQIRRYKKDDHPDYLDSHFDHLPDGYSHFKRDDKCDITVAFETEINAKAKRNYVNLYGPYFTEHIHYVCWLAPKLTTAKRIHRYLTEGRRDDKGPRHVFVTYPHFFKLGWGAPIVCGFHEGKSIRWIMEQLATNYPTTTSQPVASTTLLNLSKTPYKSKAYKYYELGDFAK